MLCTSSCPKSIVSSLPGINAAVMLLLLLLRSGLNHRFSFMYYYYDQFISLTVLLRIYLYPSSFHLKSFGYYRMDKSGASQHRGIW